MKDITDTVNDVCMVCQLMQRLARRIVMWLLLCYQMDYNYVHAVPYGRLLFVWDITITISKTTVLIFAK